MNPTVIRGAVLLAMSATACGGKVSDVDPVGTLTEHLYGLGSVAQPWPNGIVPVCFDHSGLFSPQAEPLVKAILEETWEKQAAIVFTGFGVCSGAGNQVSVGFLIGSNGYTDPKGFGAVSVTLTPDTSGPQFRYEVIHEFGHALGFLHEQERPDNWNSAGNPIHCTHLAQGETAIAGGTYYTPTNDNDSVMSYCSGFAQDLSAGDIAGVRLAYPTLKLADFGFDAGGWRADMHPRIVADVNGDKRDDIVGFGDAGVYLSLSTPTGFAAPELMVADFGYVAGGWRVDANPRMLADVNGDGKLDIVGFGNDYVMVSLATTLQTRTRGGRLVNTGVFNGFASPTFPLADFVYNTGWRVDQHPRMLGDVNGDGKADIVGFGYAGVYVSLSTGTGFTAPQLWTDGFGYDSGWRVDRHPRFLVDVNGDGMADVVGFGDAGVYLSLSTGTGFSPAQFVLAGFGYVDGGWRVDQHPRFVRDIDGDGLADIVAFGYAGVYLSRGTVDPQGTVGFGPAQFLVADFGYGTGWQGDDPTFAATRVLADVNGDHRPDIVGYRKDGGVFVSTFDPTCPNSALLSTAAAVVLPARCVGFKAPQQWGWWNTFKGSTDTSLLPPAEFLLTTADWDGDGVAGLLGFGPDGVHGIDLQVHMQ